MQLPSPIHHTASVVPHTKHYEWLAVTTQKFLEWLRDDDQARLPPAPPYALLMAQACGTVEGRKTIRQSPCGVGEMIRTSHPQHHHKPGNHQETLGGKRTQFHLWNVCAGKVMARWRHFHWQRWYRGLSGEWQRHGDPKLVAAAQRAPKSAAKRQKALRLSVAMPQSHWQAAKRQKNPRLSVTMQKTLGLSPTMTWKSGGNALH